MDAPELSIAMAAFRRAVGRAGSQAAFERLTGIRQQTVSNRLRNDIPLQGASEVLAVEAATGVSRHELRPDLYPPEPPVPSADGSSPGRSRSCAQENPGAGAPITRDTAVSDDGGHGTCDRSVLSRSGAAVGEVLA